MRTRIRKGTLVASTNVITNILAKRLIIKVIYSNISYKIQSEKVCEIRTNFIQ